MVVSTLVNHATGNAERDKASVLVSEIPGSHRITVGADKGYNRADVVNDLGAINVTVHVAQRKKGSAIDGRTTRHPGNAISQVIRKRVEEPFGWSKVIGGLRKLHHRGVELVDSCLALTMTGYHLVRMMNLLPNLGMA